MATCDVCGREEGMPYQCRLCGGTFCGDHRLPEAHDCPGLDNWNDPGGVFDSGFEESVSTAETGNRSIADRIPLDTGAGGVLGYFRGNVTYLFLTLMWLMLVVQMFVAPYLLGIPVYSGRWYALFTLNNANLTAVYPWFTAIFAHGGFTHIFFNSIVLYFFGPVVERRIGSRKFAVLFLLAGVVAGLAQVLVAAATGQFSAVLGASGAIAALLGVLTVLNPNLRIYLYFIIPMPLWVATALFAGYSLLVSSVGGIGFANVAQLAHLTGLGIGLLYGLVLKRRGARAPQQLQFGGGRRGGPGGPGRF
ncbi:MAG: rhomboid family intramembrane serine protease [Halanaeroarchaeum sp.]